jgi:hypothetical protein
MHTAHRPGALRLARARSARVLLALAMLAGALTLTVAGAGPANAITFERTSPDELVITSDRLSGHEVHATVILKLRRNGDVIMRVEAHNSGPRRKFVDADADAKSPAANFYTSIAYNQGWRINPGYYENWQKQLFDPELNAKYDTIVNDPQLYVHLHISVTLT